MATARSLVLEWAHALVLQLDVSLRERVMASQSEIAREKVWDQELGMRLVKARVAR